MKISLTSVSVNDPLHAFKFYTKVLGFREKMYMPEMNLAIIVSPDQPDGTALLLEPRGNYGSKEFFDGIYQAGLPVIVFGVEDVQQEYERLKGLGVQFTKQPKTNEWGTEAVFDDTCGNLIQIHHP
ncbi:MAG TPA: VOC family protein [Schlesneria sp.]|jgi:predicted enzyme related to lactoylglutathione lyase